MMRDIPYTIEMKLKEAIPEVKEVVAVNLGQPPF